MHPASRSLFTRSSVVTSLSSQIPNLIVRQISHIRETPLYRFFFPFHCLCEDGIKLDPGIFKDLFLVFKFLVLQFLINLLRHKQKIAEASFQLFGCAGILKVRPKTSARVTKLSQHEANGGEFQEREGVAVEIFPILGEAAATIEPRNRTFDDPALG